MVHIALLLLIYVTAPPFGPRLTTTKLGEDHFRTTGQIPENPGPKALSLLLNKFASKISTEVVRFELF